MSKKHFIALADTLRKLLTSKNTEYDPGMGDYVTGDRFDVDQRESISTTLADFCQSQNPKFDRARWLGYIAGTNGANGGAR